MFRLISDKRFDAFGPCGLSGDGEPQAVELAMPPGKAASFRDTLATLRDLHALLEQLRTVRQTYSFVYPLP